MPCSGDAEVDLRYSVADAEVNITMRVEGQTVTESSVLLFKVTIWLRCFFSIV